jgi:hypothetical protein
MEQKWIAFYNKLTGEKLAAITIEGTFQDEVESTIGLLAYEKGIQESDIETRYE